MQNAKLHEVQIEPGLEWIYSYLKKAIFQIPDLALPHRVVLARPEKIGEIGIAGECAYLSRDGFCEVRVFEETCYCGLWRLTWQRWSRAEQLECLAHEIAHVRDLNHDREHRALARRIYRSFF